MHIILVDPFGVEIPSQDSFGPLCNVLPLHTDSYGTFESLPHRSMVLMSTELQRVLAKCDFAKRGPPLVLVIRCIVHTLVLCAILPKVLGLISLVDFAIPLPIAL